MTKRYKGLAWFLILIEVIAGLCLATYYSPSENLNEQLKVIEATTVLKEKVK